MQRFRCGKVAAAGLAVITATTMSACSNPGSSNPPSSSAKPSAQASSAPRTDRTATLVGSQCAVYQARELVGPGSLAEMNKQAVAVAASHNPMLHTFSSALSGKLNPGVNLVDTVDNGSYTVFAPTDDAFNKLAPSTMNSLKTDASKLRSVLSFHVVSDRLGPKQIDGVHPTLQAGALVTVTGSGNDIKVDDAGLVCGGINTANATVYMIDTVLMPPGQ
jgi:uncharacterized surface protein with fasciclin (FAS1) repeats